MAHVSKAAILAAEDRPFEDVAVPEWGGDVRIACMSAAERDAQELRHLAIRKGEQAGSIRANLVAACLVDPATMTPIFTPAEIEELSKKSGAVLGRLFNVATRLNGLDVEEAEKIRGE